MFRFRCLRGPTPAPTRAPHARIAPPFGGPRRAVGGIFVYSGRPSTFFTRARRPRQGLAGAVQRERNARLGEAARCNLDRRGAWVAADEAPAEAGGGDEGRAAPAHQVGDG